MATLHLYASEAALELALERALAESREPKAVEVGRGLGSVPRLLREAAGGDAPLQPLAEDLLLREVQRRGGAGTAGRLRPLLSALRRAGVSPAMLRELAPRLLGRPGADARWLAEALARYEGLLGERRDAAGVSRRSLQRIATEALPSLRDIDVVVLHAAPLDPIERALVDALAARGIAVRCRVPEPLAGAARGAAAVYEDALHDAVAGALQGLESIVAAGVESAREELGAGPLPSIHTAASPALEAREIARQVRDRIAAGAAPDDIVVIADDRGRRGEIARALRRYEVPVEAVGDEHALDAEAVRLVISIYRLVEDGVPRDRLVDLLSSRYVAGDLRVGEAWISASRVARTVREVVPAGADLAGQRVALARWAEGEPAPRRAQAEAIMRHVVGRAESIAALPATTTVSHHVAALTALLERLELFTRARGFRRGSPPSAGGAVADALARDQAALRVLSDLLEALPRAAAQVGLADRALSRSELAELLTDALAQARLPVGGGRGAAVRLGGSAALEAWLPAAAPILILSGAEEGSLPRSADEDPLLSEESRRVLHRALDRELFPSSLLAERRALLALAASRAAAREVLLTWSRADADGRALLPGPLIDHARALGAIETRGPLLPIPELGAAREPGELLARFAIERYAPAVARQGLSPTAQERLHAALAAHDPARVARVERLAAIERTRAAFFAGERAAGVFDGRLGDDATIAALVAGPLPGSATRPLSASTLSSYVECPQRFFLDAVLRLRAPEEQGDDLDDRASGRLAHLGLELMFRGWQAAGLLPLRGRAEEQAVIRDAVDEAARTWSERGPRGHDLVWRARLRALSRMLEGVWRAELADPPAPGLLPTHFEMPFDGLSVAGDAGEAVVHLGGSIDRVDLARDEQGRLRAAVFDYKSGALASRASDLKEESFAETSWQLPLYAAALRARHGVERVEVLYYSLRELRTKGAPAPAWLTVERSVDPATPSLGDRVLALARSMRAGQFDVAPRADACKRCRLQPGCRIAVRRGDGEELAE